MNFYNEHEHEQDAEYILIEGGKYKYSVTNKEVEVPPLYFAKYPVTNKLYRQFVNDTGMRFNSSYADDRRFNGDELPVVGITWFSAQEYCRWLSEKTGKTFRLPTEQEWEWAASGGKRKYPWGNEEPDETRANYGGKVGQTTPAGAYPAGATPEGLMDMAGNVWEWMENLYGKGAYHEDARALRGGSWYDSATVLPCVARSYYHPVYRWYYSSFRVVAVQSSFNTLKF